MKKTKRAKKSRTWVIKQHRDQFFKKAKVLGYKSRAAFKLIELNKKFNFIKKKLKFIRYWIYTWRLVASCLKDSNQREDSCYRYNTNGRIE